VPTPSYAAILPDDTRLSWLQREDLDHYWIAHPATGEPVGTAGEADPLSGGFYFCTISEADFARYKKDAFATPPIWPGIDGVTLGETVPAVASTVLEVPMHGMLWLTTTYPAARARWGAAPYYSVYHTGRLAFITDNGDLEPFQYMGWQNAIYVPQTMGRAAGVVVFLEAGIEGAITPWDLLV
jgi:hypothetical protein